MDFNLKFLKLICSEDAENKPIFSLHS